MLRRHDAHRLCLAACVIACASVASAQKPVTEFWPELDVYWQPAARQRTMFELSSRAEREGSKSEATVGIYQDYLQLPAYYLRGGFRYTFSTQDASYREERAVGEAVVTLYSTQLVRLLQRNRVELRWVNGEYSYRLRERLHFQRLSQSGKPPALAPYGTFEAYYDSRYRTIARLAGRIGTEAQFGAPVSIDIYIARQNNSRSDPRYVNALGITTKLIF